MIGTQLYQRKSQVRFFLATYGLLALAGLALAAAAIRRGEGVSGAAGFMVVFGAGMAVNALLRGRRAQVSVYEDFLQVNQSRSLRDLRYRNITAVSRPDRDRLLVTLREDSGVRNEVIWLKELEPAEVGRLIEFLGRRKGKA